MIRALATALALAAALAQPAPACTRITYLGPEGRVLTGRSFDWKLPIASNLWAFPRGMERDGAAGLRSLRWTSLYGSLVVSGYDISTVDGMNEAGLVANLQWLADAEYPADDGTTPRVSVSVWAQMVLDRFATVAEAVAWLDANPLDVATGEVPAQPGRLTTVHLALSDATGDSAILEWIAGELVVHHGREFRVLTNEPRYTDQLAVQRYWAGVDPRQFMPGTTRATDRFVRASFYADAVEQSAAPRVAAAATMSVVRAVSVPWGISLPDAPNLATTRWRVAADQTDLLYYVESALSPNTFWVDLRRLDLAEGAPVLRLDLGVDMARIVSGEASALFEPATPFAFEEAP